MYAFTDHQSASRCNPTAFARRFMFLQAGCDWFFLLHIPSSVEAEVVVAEEDGLPLVPSDPVAGCFMQLV